MIDGLTFKDYQKAIWFVIKTIKDSKSVDEVWSKLRICENRYLENSELEYKIAWDNNSDTAFQLYLAYDELAWVIDNFASELEYYEGLDGYISFPFTLDFAKQLVSTWGYDK